MTPTQFNLAVQRQVDEMLGSMLADVQQELCLEGLRRVATRTPFDTGRARGNWQVGIDERPTGEVNRLGADAAIQAGSAEIKKLKAFGTCHITNNLSYIVPLEDGHSQQGSHMVESTLNELVEILI